MSGRGTRGYSSNRYRSDRNKNRYRSRGYRSSYQKEKTECRFSAAGKVWLFIGFVLFSLLVIFSLIFVL